MQVFKFLVFLGKNAKKGGKNAILVFSVFLGKNAKKRGKNAILVKGVNPNSLLAALDIMMILIYEFSADNVNLWMMCGGLRMC